MPNTKPYVAAACICEKVLTEPDGVASVIRIIDTFSLAIPDSAPPDFKGEVALPLTAFVSIKAGDVRGSHEVGLVLRSPSGKPAPVQRWPVVLNGGEHGANLKIDLFLGEPELGLYWLDVLWGEDVLTSIPFRLRRADEAPGEAAPSTSTTSSTAG